MAYTTINKSTDYFTTATWSGSGSQQTISLPFQADWIWVKRRNGTANHASQDIVNAFGNRLSPNRNVELSSEPHGIGTVDANGFNFRGSYNGSGYNESGGTYVSWNWKAGGTASANTDGDINSSVSVNTTAGFSIVKYTGTDVAGATVGHGLGAVPKMIMVKRISGNGYDWVVYHKDKTAGLYLNSDGYNNDSSSNNIWFNGAAPTSSVFSIGTDGRIGDATDFIAYCFAEKPGYSKFGSYTGNGNADGTFVYTGFKPQFIIQKPVSTTQNWQIHDTKRPGYNVKNYNLSSNNNNAEADNEFIDIVSNGFKNRTNGALNSSGVTYIYMAFGQSLVGSNNVPCTAR